MVSRWCAESKSDVPLVFHFPLMNVYFKESESDERILFLCSTIYFRLVAMFFFFMTTKLDAQVVYHLYK